MRLPTSLRTRPGRFTENVARTLVAQGIYLVLSLVTYAILVRRLGASGKGMMDLAMLVPRILGLVLSLGIGVANIYFIGTRRYALARLASNSISLALLTGGAGLALIAVFLATDLPARLLPGVPAWLIALAALGLPIVITTTYFNGILQGLYRIATLNLLLVFQGIATLVLTLLLVSWLDLGLPGAVAASLSGLAVPVIAAAVVLRRLEVSLRPRWDAEVSRQTVSFGMRSHVGNVMQSLNYRLDSFLVNGFCGPAQVGIYGVAVRLAEMLWYLPDAVSFVILPKAARTDPGEMNRFTPRAFRITLAVTAVAALGLLLVGRPLIAWIFSEEFSPAYRPMIALLPGVVLLGGSKVLSNEMAGRGYPHYFSWICGIALFFTVVFDLALIPQHGILGAAIASSVAYTAGFISAVALFLRVRRHSPRIKRDEQQPR